MLSQQQCLGAFHRHAAGADVCVVEGVMVRAAGWCCELTSASRGCAACIVMSAGLPAQATSISADGAAAPKQTLLACVRSTCFTAQAAHSSDMLC